MPNMSLAQAKLNSALLSSPETIKILGLGYDTPKCMYETLKDICPPCGLISVVCQRQVGKEKRVPSGCVAKLLSQLKTNQGRKINNIVLFGVVVRILFFHSVCPRSSRKA